MSSIFSPDGKSTIGFVDYRQRRRGDVLEIVRVARFSDGSSDEDRVEARIAETLWPCCWGVYPARVDLSPAGADGAPT